MSLNAMNSGRPQAQQQQQQQRFGLNNNNKDVETVRRNYKAALTELTFNSKPIITNLTIMAQENQPAASIIVREIENQLRNNAIGQKLPVLYLIDSICKNVGGVYITNFDKNIVNTFLDAFALVDPTVQKSFERLFSTWKNGMPGGRPVFPRHVIEPIEKNILYIRERQNMSKYPNVTNTTNNTARTAGVNNNKLSNSPSPTTHQHNNNAGIHVNPNFYKKDPRNNSQRDPRNRSPQIINDKIIQTPDSSANILNQLKSIFPPNQPTLHENTAALGTNTSVTQIIGQIKSILPTLPASQASSIEHYLAQIASPSLLNVSIPTSTAPHLQQAFNSAVSTPTPPLLPATISPVISAASATAPVDTTDLLKSLTSLGYLSSSPSLTTHVTSTATPPPPPIPSSPSISSSQFTLQQHGPFHLDSKDLQIVRPNAFEILYSAEPLQCKQCGFRYPKTEKGQQRMDAHLDSHFRQNRKMKERVKRGLSRSWFVSVQDWIDGEGGELTHQQMPAFLHENNMDRGSDVGNSNLHNGNNANGNNKDGAGAGAGGSENAINPNDYTVVMPDDDVRKPCLICGERFIDSWNDDEEEWIYKNAINVNDKIYHATCYTDAAKTKEASTETEDTEMPDVNNNDSSADIKAGTKRKIKEEDKISKFARTEYGIST